jgi:hypothetical protein
MRCRPSAEAAQQVAEIAVHCRPCVVHIGKGEADAGNTAGGLRGASRRLKCDRAFC